MFTFPHEQLEPVAEGKMSSGLLLLFAAVVVVVEVSL